MALTELLYFVLAKLKSIKSIHNKLQQKHATQSNEYWKSFSHEERKENRKKKNKHNFQ